MQLARARTLALPFLAASAAGLHAQEALDWQPGPMTGDLGRIAEIDVPADCVFLDADDTRRLLELMENPVSGQELGTLAPAAEDEYWMVFFEFDEVGYVEDDDRDELDADDLLDGIRAGNEQANEERRRRGWGTVEVIGWEVEPRYEPATNNLEWAIVGEGDGGRSINHNTRLLGRRGVMEVGLVCDPEELAGALPRVREYLGGFRYKDGHRYGQYTSGDKIAQYGLAGLVAGGGLALAAKTGLLQKFWKLIVVAAVAVAAFFKKLFGGRRGAREREA